MNRKQRRTIEKVVQKEKAKPAPTQDGGSDYQDAMSKRMHELATNERIKMLVTGQVPPPNEIVDYLVNEYRKARQEYDATRIEVSNLEKNLETQKEKLLVLQGGVNKYLEDAMHWLKRTDQRQREREEAGREEAGQKPKLPPGVTVVDAVPGEDPPPLEEVFADQVREANEARAAAAQDEVEDEAEDEAQDEETA